MAPRSNSRPQRVYQMMQQLEPGLYHVQDLADGLAYLYPESDSVEDGRMTPETSLTRDLSSVGDQRFITAGKGYGLYGLSQWGPAESLDVQLPTVLQLMETAQTSNSSGEQSSPWQLDELLLALDLFFKHPPNLAAHSHPAMVELSSVLKKLPIHTERSHRDSSRSPGEVYLKLGQFLRLSVGKLGAGRATPLSLEGSVWAEFAQDRERLARVAATIRESVLMPTGPVDVQEPAEGEDEYAEGKIVYRLHRMRERDSRVVKEAKASRAVLACEVCDFDFQKVYGEELGKRFIEAHHTKPVSQMKPDDKTKASDLAMVCSNCHRMLHQNTCITVHELRERIARNGWRFSL